MHAVIVVPGIMGTRLVLPGEHGNGDEEVWPPTALETQIGYKRREKLASPKCRPGAIIEKVLCLPFYGLLFDLLKSLGFAEDGPDQRLVKFPYDWRRDLFDTARALAGVIEKAHQNGAKRITVVGHSMGGLVSRLALEDPANQGKPWFGVIDQFIAIATPHAGAPLALARILGVDSSMGVSGADFAWLAAKKEYPSAYQLLPAPGEDACWDQANVLLNPVNIYKQDGIALLGLVPELVGRVRAVHDVLGAGNRPTSVRYFYFAAAGHRTVTRVNVYSKGAKIDPQQTVVTWTEAAGDGTVPLVSALARAPQRHIATNEHSTAFKGSAFRSVLVRLFGRDEGPATEAMETRTTTLSIEAPVVPVGRNIELLVSAEYVGSERAAHLTQLSGELALRRVRDGEKDVDEAVWRMPIAYSGPPVALLRLYLPPVTDPGHYTVTLWAGTDEVASASFSACRG